MSEREPLITVTLDTVPGTGTPALWTVYVSSSYLGHLHVERGSFAAVLAALRVSIEEWERQGPPY